MKFDVKVTEEAHCMRVAVQGHGGPGRLQSLLQVLRLESESWGPQAVLLDLRELEPALPPAQLDQIAVLASRALQGRRVAVLARHGRFADESAALDWFAHA